MPHTSEKYLNISRCQIYCKIWEVSDQSHPPVFLLHDSLGCVELWRDFPEKLAQKLNRNVIAYDRLGFGKSSARSEPPSFQFIEEEAEIDFPEILEQLKIKDFDLFGHSVGGAMAVAIAARTPGCRSLITESSQAFVEDLTLKGIRAAQKSFQDPTSFSRLEKYHGDKARWVLQAWTDIWLDPKFAGWSLSELLPEVKCPLLALHGDKDEFGSKVFPEFLTQYSGGPSHFELLQDCGHVAHREKPELILEMTTSFYNKQRPL